MIKLEKTIYCLNIRIRENTNVLSALYDNDYLLMKKIEIG